jgi:hypothetical protein
MLSFRPVGTAKLISAVIFCSPYNAHFLVKLSQCAIHQHLLTKVFLHNKKIRGVKVSVDILHRHPLTSYGPDIIINKATWSATLIQHC